MLFEWKNAQFYTFNTGIRATLSWEILRQPLNVSARLTVKCMIGIALLSCSLCSNDTATDCLLTINSLNRIHEPLTIKFTFPKAVHGLQVKTGVLNYHPNSETNKLVLSPWNPMQKDVSFDAQCCLHFKWLGRISESKSKTALLLIFSEKVLMQNWFRKVSVSNEKKGLVTK